MTYQRARWANVDPALPRSVLRMSSIQKLSRMPKRHWRDWFGPYVDVIKPKVALLMSDCGLAKFAWFVALSASARNCNLTLSDKVNVRKMLKSVSKKPGPRRVFRPTDPKRAPVSGIHAQFAVQF